MAAGGAARRGRWAAPACCGRCCALQSTAGQPAAAPLPTAQAAPCPLQPLTRRALLTPPACLLQFNLLPVQFSLRDTRCENMLGITRAALALCVLLYGTVAAGGYVLFGDE